MLTSERARGEATREYIRCFIQRICFFQVLLRRRSMCNHCQPLGSYGWLIKLGFAPELKLRERKDAQVLSSNKDPWTLLFGGL